MKHALFILATAFALGGCVSHNFSEGQRTHFRCEGGKEFSYRRVGDAIEVFASGATHRLEPRGDGSYASANGQIVFTGSSLSGVYEGPFENCRQQTRWSRFF